MRKFSNSEVQAFKHCPRKWWLAWHLGLQPRANDLVSIRRMGTRIHAALASYYTTESEDPLLAHAWLVEADLAAFRHNEEVRGFEDSEGLKKLLAATLLERIMLEGYVEWLAETGADSDLEIVESEQYLEVPFIISDFINGEFTTVHLIGKLDTRVLDRRTGKKKFMDHKSVGSFDVPMLRQNEQMLHYELLEYALSGEHVAGAYYNMIRRVKRTARAKPPFYKRVEITHNIQELDSYANRLHSTIKNILRLEKQVEQHSAWPFFAPPEAYPNPGRDCAWKCPFVKICPMFDDGSRVKDAIEAMFVPGDPLSYYQREDIDDEDIG